MSEKKSLEEQLFVIGLVVLPVAAVLLGAYWFFIKPFLPPIPCVFSGVLGFYCPGCGGTRAVEALFQGKLLLSFWYHPIVPYMAVCYSGFMVTNGLHKLGVKKIRGWKFRLGFLWGAVIILGGNFVLKNVLRLCFGIMM